MLYLIEGYFKYILPKRAAWPHKEESVTQIVLERRRAAPVVTRENIALSPYIVSHAVPKHPTVHEGRPERGLKPYLSWPMHVGESKVWVYLHGANPAQHIGRTVAAIVRVMERTREDGTVEPYIDLHVYDGTPLHRLFVVSGHQGELGWFACGLGTQGMRVVVAPLNVKFTKDKGFYIPEPKPEKPKSTGNPMLDRMIAEGWAVTEETPTAYKLEKVGRKLEMAKPKKLRTAGKPARR